MRVGHSWRCHCHHHSSYLVAAVPCGKDPLCPGGVRLRLTQESESGGSGHKNETCTPKQLMVGVHTSTPSIFLRSCQCVGKSTDFAQSPCKQTSTATLCEECTSIDTLNAKISAAEKSLLEMKQARQEALTKPNRKHDVLMNRFPLEICSEIF